MHFSVGSSVHRWLAVASTVMALAACGLLVDTSGLSGPEAPGGAPGDGGDAGPLADASNDSLPFQDVGTDGSDAGALDYRMTVLADGPVAYFRLAETSGTVAHDETTTHDGTFSGGVQLGQPGPGAGTLSARFPGDGHVSADSVATLPSGTYAAYTIEAFVASEVPAGISGFVCAFTDASGGGGPAIFIVDTTRKLRFAVRGYSVDSTIALGASWHHVVVTSAAGKASLYVDGVLDLDGLVASPTPARAAFTIGALASSADGGPTFTQQFYGRISDLAIYAHALTPERIAAHYAARR